MNACLQRPRSLAQCYRYGRWNVTCHSGKQRIHTPTGASVPTRLSQSIGVGRSQVQSVWAPKTVSRLCVTAVNPVYRPKWLVRLNHGIAEGQQEISTPDGDAGPEEVAETILPPLGGLDNVLKEPSIPAVPIFDHATTRNSQEALLVNSREGNATSEWTFAMPTMERGETQLLELQVPIVPNIEGATTSSPETSAPGNVINSSEEGPGATISTPRAVDDWLFTLFEPSSATLYPSSRDDGGVFLEPPTATSTSADVRPSRVASPLDVLSNMHLASEIECPEHLNSVVFSTLTKLEKTIVCAFELLGMESNGKLVHKAQFKTRCERHVKGFKASMINGAINRLWGTPMLVKPQNWTPPILATQPFEKWVESRVDFSYMMMSLKEKKKFRKDLKNEANLIYSKRDTEPLARIIQAIENRFLGHGKAEKEVTQESEEELVQETEEVEVPHSDIPTSDRKMAWLPPDDDFDTAAIRSRALKKKVQPFRKHGKKHVSSAPKEWELWEEEMEEMEEMEETEEMEELEAKKRELYKPPLNPRIEELRAYAAQFADSPVPESFPEIDHHAGVPPLEDQQYLLSNQEVSDLNLVDDREIERAVFFTPEVLEQKPGQIPQFGLFGGAMETDKRLEMADSRVFLNTNHPSSFFICGLQGSGKSHSLSAIIENHLIRSRTLGALKQRLSGLVFHYGQFSSAQTFRPCEAAFLAFPDPMFRKEFPPVPVTVLVPPSNFPSLNACYSQIPRITVKPLKIRPELLNVGSILTLMSVDSSSQTPLYLGQVTKTLRDMAAESPFFNYRRFIHRLGKLNLQAGQRKPLQQRLELLESFLDLEDHHDDDASLSFPEGSLTIVDLSCPFVDENTACVLFEIMLGIYLGDSGTAAATGKVIALDEAHKYIINTPGAKSLTESLLTTIRQQRHYGARVIISTQEPTIDPRLMDLSSATVIHRFTSPDWFSTLRRHVSVLEDQEMFHKIVNLKVGEALVFAPSAICNGEKLNGKMLGVKVRRRVTWDGGKSIMSQHRVIEAPESIPESAAEPSLDGEVENFVAESDDLAEGVRDVEESSAVTFEAGVEDSVAEGGQDKPLEGFTVAEQNDSVQEADESSAETTGKESV